MPAEFTIDLERHLVLSRAWGVLVDEDLRQTQRGVRDTPGFEPHFRQVYDFSDVTEVCLTSEGLRDIARHSPFAKDARRAIVVKADVAYGLVRMYQMVSNVDTERFRIFRTRDEALLWIGDGRPAE